MTTELRTQETDPYNTLTRREREVLHFSAEGLTNIEMALRLVISSRTVEGHIANIRRKLRISSRSRLIRYAVIREGWSTPS